mmetsp:Transcript_22237/g.44790  ORF Transcript_22237/g.44790 Transcript_22237/m.44790 type:complete len:84 (-) Transcript_22237:1393-1644(-)
MLVPGIEASSDQTAETSNEYEQKELPNGIIARSVADGSKLSEGKQFIDIRLPPLRVLVADGEKRSQSNHGAEEGTPREFGRPV